jgi:hypothetical protein
VGAEELKRKGWWLEKYPKYFKSNRLSNKSELPLALSARSTSKIHENFTFFHGPSFSFSTL